MTIPSSTPYEIKKGQRGTAVWALQRALNELGYDCPETAAFGRETEDKVIAFQIEAILKQDGSVGPQTQAVIAEALASVTLQVTSHGLPDGLIKSIVEGESGNKIAAVNRSVPGGVDCGFTQRRVYEKDYSNQAAIKRAFDGLYQMKLLAKQLRERHDTFFGQPGARTHQVAWRLAVLNHNYPAAATNIASLGVARLPAYWTMPQPWVQAIGARFPDGRSVVTPLDWCRHYSLGWSAADEPGMMVKYVQSWN